MCAEGARGWGLVVFHACSSVQPQAEPAGPAHGHALATSSDRAWLSHIPQSPLTGSVTAVVFAAALAQVVDALRPTHARAAANEVLVLRHLAATQAGLAEGRRRRGLGRDPQQSSQEGLMQAHSTPPPPPPSPPPPATVSAPAPAPRTRRFFMRCVDAFSLPAWPHGVRPWAWAGHGALTSSDDSGEPTHGSLSARHGSSGGGGGGMHGAASAQAAMPEHASCACLVLERAGHSLGHCLAAQRAAAAQAQAQAAHRHAGMPLPVVKQVARSVLQALDFMHR